jgi:hypothetical protein
MKTKTKLLGISSMLIAVLFLTLPASEASTEKTPAPNQPTVTKIKVNGFSCDTFLFDGDTNTNGFLNVGRDEIANTTAIDFSYLTPDPNDPEIVILIQGAGEIPNNTFTISLTEAHLAVTTPFPSHYCVVNIVTGVFDCEDGAPITFDLTWVGNGFGSIREKTHRTETYGPLTTVFKGEYESRTATVNGTWTDHTASDLLGNLVDSKNNLNIREITLAANP